MLSDILVGVIVAIICAAATWAGRIALKNIRQTAATDPRVAESLIVTVAAGVALLAVIAVIAAGWVSHFVLIWLAEFVAALLDNPSFDASEVVTDWLAGADSWAWQWTAAILLIVCTYISVDVFTMGGWIFQILWSLLVIVAGTLAWASHTLIDGAFSQATLTGGVPWVVPWTVLVATGGVTTWIFYRGLLRTAATR